MCHRLASEEEQVLEWMLKILSSYNSPGACVAALIDRPEKETSNALPCLSCALEKGAVWPLKGDAVRDADIPVALCAGAACL